MKVPTVKKEEAPVLDEERVPAYWTMVSASADGVHMLNLKTNRTYIGTSKGFRETFLDAK